MSLSPPTLQLDSNPERADAKGMFGHLKAGYVDGAYDKALEALVDPDFPRRLLPPYETLPDADFAVIKKYFEEKCRDIS